MESIAIITARGGSKRIPKKNIKNFCGKPIIAYSIEAALKADIFDEVMVSTDSDEIAEISRKYGAKIPFMRSEKTSNDFATTADVITEVLDQYKAAGIHFEYACCIYPTAPFITAGKIIQAMKQLRDSNADSVLPLVPFSYPPQRGLIINNGTAEMKYPEYVDSRSQDLEKIYHDCGQFYCFKTASFRNTGKIMTGKISPIIIPELEMQDIDTLEDWKLAELKFILMQKEI